MKQDSVIKSRNVKLVGFDWVIDIYGDIYFLEGNATCYGLRRYSEIYDDSLNQAIVGMLNNEGVIGVNVDPKKYKENPAFKNRYGETKFLLSILNDANMKHIVAEDDEINLYQGKFLAGTSFFDLLFNRRIGFCSLYDRIYSNPFNYNTISDVNLTKLLINKFETNQVLESSVNLPLTYVAYKHADILGYYDLIKKHIKIKKPDYLEPYVLIKPIFGTGGEGIQIINNSLSFIEPNYPVFVQERICSTLIEGHVSDFRSFYINGWISNSIMRVSPHKVNKFHDDSYITSLCNGGIPFRSDQCINERIKEETRIAVAGLEDYLNK